MDCKLSEFIGREAPAKNIARNEIYSRKNIKAATASGLNGISLQITHHSLWESYATAIEYVDDPEKFEFPSKFDNHNVYCFGKIKFRKTITLSIPQTCNCLEHIKSYLQSWIDDHCFDVQINFELQ